MLCGVELAVLAAVQNGKPPNLSDYANSPAANWKPEDSQFDVYELCGLKH
jgi:hypothetical protein